MGALHRGVTLAAAAVVSGLVLAGCVTVQGGPNRLYSVAEEVAMARAALEKTIKDYDAVSPDQRQFYRNEYIARRMYIIDVEYAEYEAALTGERQKFGFVTTTAATGLGIASTLTTPLQAAQLLSGISAGVLGIRGAYDTEVIIAKSIQIIQGHMRAQRDIVAARILLRVNESIVTYTLSDAMRDAEDYYLAGTFASGLIPALRESGNAADIAADNKSRVVRGVFRPDTSTDILDRFLRPAGKLDRRRLTCVNECLNKFPGLRRPGSPRLNILARMDDAGSATIRVHAIQCAQLDPQCLALQ